MFLPRKEVTVAKTHLVTLAGDDRPAFGVVEQDAVVEERRVLEGRTGPEGQRMTGRSRGPPGSNGDHHEEMGTHHKVMRDHPKGTGDHPEITGDHPKEMWDPPGVTGSTTK